MMSPEPGTALRALTDLPLKQALDPAPVEAINKLASEIRASSPATDWTPIYAYAVRISEELLGGTDRRLEDLQRRALTVEDPMEARNRIAQAPRREADRFRGEAKANVQKLLREWIDRAKRQQEHVATGCAPLLREDNLVQVAVTAHGLALSLNSQWWTEFLGYVSRCCDEWTKNFCMGAEQGLESAMVQGLGEMTKRHSLPAAQNAFAQPPTDSRFDTQLTPRDVEIPGIWAQFFRSARTLVPVLGSLVVGVTGGVASAGHGSIAVLISVVSATITMAMVGLGLKEAKHQQVVLRERGITTWRDAVTAQVRGDLDKVLDRHRRALERWATQRAEQWTSAIDRWWDTHIEAHLASADTSAADQARELKLQQSRMQEEISNLRSFRNQLAQTVLFELRRRLRELSDSAQHTP